MSDPLLNALGNCFSEMGKMAESVVDESERENEAMRQRLSRIAEILRPKLDYALKNASNPYNVMIGPFSDYTARELQALLGEGT